MLHRQVSHLKHRKMHISVSSDLNSIYHRDHLSSTLTFMVSFYTFTMLC